MSTQVQPQHTQWTDNPENPTIGGVIHPKSSSVDDILEALPKKALCRLLLAAGVVTEGGSIHAPIYVRLSNSTYARMTVCVSDFTLIPF